MADGNDTNTELSSDVKAQIEQAQTHVVYCPDCREELARYEDRGNAEETIEMHHIGTGHSPAIITGVYSK